MIHFKYRGEAVGKDRPRFVKRGNYIQTYTPKKTKMFEDAMRFECRASTCEPMPVYPKGTSLMATILIGVSVPQSYSKKKTAQCLAREIAPDKKPDIDNIIKAVLDGLNGYAFEDDSQVTEIFAEKFYSESPFVDVTIRAKDEE